MLVDPSPPSMVIWMPPMSSVHGLVRTGGTVIRGFDIGANRFLGRSPPEFPKSAPAGAPEAPLRAPSGGLAGSWSLPVVMRKRSVDALGG